MCACCIVSSSTSCSCIDQRCRSQVRASLRANTPSRAFCAVLKQVAERQSSPKNKIQLVCFVSAGQYSVQEAFEGSTVLITGATGTVQLLSLIICSGQGVMHRKPPPLCAFRLHRRPCARAASPCGQDWQGQACGAAPCLHACANLCLDSACMHAYLIGSMQACLVMCAGSPCHACRLTLSFAPNVVSPSRNA